MPPFKHFASIWFCKGSSLDIKVQTLQKKKKEERKREREKKKTEREKEREKERNTHGWLPVLGQSVLTRKVASETRRRWKLSSCLQRTLGPPRPQCTGIWRNAQTMENIRALCFPARDAVTKAQLGF